MNALPPRTIRWTHPKPEFAEQDAVIWLDVSLVDRSWSKNGTDYFGRGGTGKTIGSRYFEVARHLNATRELWMPRVDLSLGEVIIDDGRHRFAWLRDHGAKAVCALASPSEAREIRARFGSPLRQTTYLPLVKP